MRPRHRGRRAPQPRATPSLILGVECTFERSSVHSIGLPGTILRRPPCPFRGRRRRGGTPGAQCHMPGVQAAKPEWRRAPQAGRPLRDGPRGQGTKPPQADAPSTGPRCIEATPRQTDAAGHHSHMRAQRHPVLISSNRGPATRFRDDGKTARQLRGGRTSQYGDLWRRDGRGAPPRGLRHSTRQITTNKMGL